MGVPKLSDEDIRNVITPLLLSGAKMLDRHCPRCGSPLFEKDGRVFCPLCERGEHGEGTKSDGKVVDALLKKFEEMASSMPKEQEALERHLRIMEQILNVVNGYVAVVEKLKRGKWGDKE